MRDELQLHTHDAAFTISERRNYGCFREERLQSHKSYQRHNKRHKNKYIRSLILEGAEKRIYAVRKSDAHKVIGKTRLIQRISRDELAADYVKICDSKETHTHTRRSYKVPERSTCDVLLIDRRRAADD